MPQAESNMQRIVRELAEKAQQLEQEKLQQMEKERQDVLIKMLSALYDKASAYTKMIVGIGYAGFFTIWIHLKEFMGDWERVASGTGILISGVIYVLAEVNNMFSRQKEHLELNEIAGTPIPGFQKKLEDYNKKSDQKLLKSMAASNRILIYTLIFGIIGIGIMLYSFARYLATN